MNDLNQIRGTIHPITSIIGLCFAIAALLRLFGIVHAYTTADLALVALALLAI